MIDPSFDTLTDPKPSIVQELENRVEQLQITLNNYRQLTALSETRVENLRDWLIENADGSIDKRTAEDIAEIMDIELVKDYYFDVVVRFTGSIQIGMGEDAEEILADSQFDMNNYGDHEFHVSDASVEEIDITDYN